MNFAVIAQKTQYLLSTDATSVQSQRPGISIRLVYTRPTDANAFRSLFNIGRKY